MTRSPDPDRLILAYLEEGVTELPDRAYEVIRSDIDRTRQRVVVGPWRTPQMHSFAKWVIAAAAVVVVALVGYNLLPSQGGVGGPASSPSQSPSRSPSTAASGPPSIAASPSDAIHAGLLEPGTYTIYAQGGTNTNVRLTVPAGWHWVDGFHLTTSSSKAPDGVAIGFWTDDLQVYADPCKWDAGEPDPPTGPTARALVDALAAQPTRNASTPIERMGKNLEGADRWEGWSVDLTVPDDLDFSRCAKGQYRSWGPEDSVRYHQGPGQRDTVWAVDVDPGVRVVVDLASFPGTPQKTMTEARSILESLVFGHWG